MTEDKNDNNVSFEINKYVNHNVSNIIINYLKPLPILPYIDELKINTEPLYLDGERYYNYNNYFVDKEGRYKRNASYKYGRYKFFDRDTWFFQMKV